MATFSVEIIPPKYSSESDDFRKKYDSVFSEPIQYVAFPNLTDFPEFYRFWSRLFPKDILVQPTLTTFQLTRPFLERLLKIFSRCGIRRIRVVTGDRQRHPYAISEDYAYASEIIRDIRKISQQDFQIQVTAYPERAPLADELKILALKKEADANEAVTQILSTVAAYEDFLKALPPELKDFKIIPGILKADANNSQRIQDKTKIKVLEDFETQLKRLESLKSPEVHLFWF